MSEILVPTRPSDVIDQISLLQGKAQTSADPDAYVAEWQLLHRVADRVLPKEPDLDVLRVTLVKARSDLMQLEADLRACEAEAEFGIAFVALTRAYLIALDELDQAKIAFDLHAAILLSVPADTVAQAPDRF